MAILGLLAVVALALVVYVRASRRAIRLPSPQTAALHPPALRWTQRVTGKAPLPDARERMAIARRLELLGGAWSATVLEEALADEYDAEVRGAIWHALLAVRRAEACDACEIER